MGEVGEYTVSQVILKLLISEGISVIPRTASLEHLELNSARALAAMPDLSAVQRARVQKAVHGLLRGKDDGYNEDEEHPLPGQVIDEDTVQPVARFVNLFEEAVHIFWRSEDGDHFVSEVAPGEDSYHGTWPGHVF